MHTMAHHATETNAQLYKKHVIRMHTWMYIDILTDTWTDSQTDRESV